MKPSSIRVAVASAGLSVQDFGRYGHRAIGVPVSGALDQNLRIAANILAKNPENAAVLESRWPGACFVAHSEPVRIAIAGGARGMIERDGASFEMGPFASIVLRKGDSLRMVGGGLSYIAFSGGILTSPMLGSRATHAPSSLGGVNGRLVRSGDILPCLSCENEKLGLRATCAWRAPNETIRVMMGPQDDYFTQRALETFLTTPFRATAQMDRMGVRLAGERLTHNARGGEIISDCVTPGAIQTPPSGQPIVLLADCQTTGGYPKIACVIRADLPLLAHLRPDDAVRFIAVGRQEAAQAFAIERRRLETWRMSIQNFAPGCALNENALNENALNTENLISGVVSQRPSDES